MTDYFSELPEATQAQLAAIATKYLPLIPGADPAAPIPDAVTCWLVLYWQQLETEIISDHADWLARVQASVERRGLTWNRENFLRYCREHES
jgi:hypothetical protein